MNNPSVPPAENAPLFLLDGLDGPELEAYTLARRYDPVVQAAECEAAETLADLALSVPQIAPPESCLAAIRTEIQTTSHPLPVRFIHRLLRVSPGWAAAAALAILAGWSMLKRSDAEKELAQLREKQQQQEKALRLFAAADGGAGNPDKPASGDPVLADAPGPLEAPGRNKNRSTPNGRTGSHQLIQDLPALQARLNLLEKRNAQRLQPVPGLHRPVIFEMQDPDESPAGDGHKLTLSSGKVGDILAEALLSGHSGTNKSDPSAPEKPPFRIGESNRDDEVLIESGMRDLSVFQLPDEVHVRNLGLPVDQAAANGLQPLPDGSGFYEPTSNLIWRPAADGRGYIGRRPPENFSPPSASPEIPAPATTPPPAAPDATATRAFPIFDESTGQGSIILQNLPAPDAGKTWQLWFTDPEVAAPFSPGILPDLETGSGRVFFDLGRTGYAPASCFLTQEPTGGSTQPTGQVVLKGP